MGFDELKVGRADFAGRNIQSIEEDTVIGNAAELKRLFDAPAQEVLAEKINAILDALQEANAAAALGAVPLHSEAGRSIQSQLQYLYGQISAATAGVIPDGSLTDEKLSNASGNVLPRLAAAIETLGGLTEHAGNEDLHVSAQQKQSWSNTVSGLDNHTANAAMHVNSEQKSAWTQHKDDAEQHLQSGEREAWNTCPRYLAQCTNADSATQTGLYYMTANTAGAPDSGGYFLAVLMANGRGVQLAAINGTTARYWIRSYSSGSWQAWRKIVTTDMFSYSGGTLSITTN